MPSKREIAEQNEILRVINGSKLYGTNVDTSDDDFQAIFVEPRTSVFGVGKVETVQLRDKPEGVRSEAGDVDCTSYSLRHFCKLAADGNPSVLTLLFAPSSAVISKRYEAQWLFDNATLFSSKNAGPRFRGYMYSQKQRLLGERGGHMPSRPELVEEYGYDTKYANHVVRLGLQGIEFMSTGRMTLPMDPADVSLLISIRNGGVGFDDAVAMMEELEERLRVACDDSPLPDEPNWDEIARHLDLTHQAIWNNGRFVA